VDRKKVWAMEFAAESMGARQLLPAELWIYYVGILGRLRALEDNITIFN